MMNRRHHIRREDDRATAVVGEADRLLAPGVAGHEEDDDARAALRVSRSRTASGGSSSDRAMCPAGNGGGESSKLQAIADRLQIIAQVGAASSPTIHQRIFPLAALHDRSWRAGKVSFTPRLGFGRAGSNRASRRAGRGGSGRRHDRNADG